MMSTIRPAGIALLAMTVAVSVCLAQEVTLPPTPDSTAAAPAPVKPDSAAHAPAARKVELTPGNTPTRAALGGLIGGSFIYSANDYSEGALPRYDFAGHWRYVLSPRWRWQLGVGFTWSAYSKHKTPPFQDPAFPSQTTKEGYLTQMVPAYVQAQALWGGGHSLWHVGAGPGLTHINVQNQRKVLKDPVTYAAHHEFAWGLTGEIGWERFFKGLPSTSFEADATTHYLWAADDARFPSGWSSVLAVACVRVGANYYFDARILKKKTPEKLPLNRNGGK